MDVIALIWTGLFLAGVTFAALVLREHLADWHGVLAKGASAQARAFLRELLRAAWFRLVVLASFAAAGIIPAVVPLKRQPTWAGLVSLVALLLGAALLVIDSALALRAKRRFLARFRTQEG